MQVNGQILHYLYSYHQFVLWVSEIVVCWIVVVVRAVGKFKVTGIGVDVSKIMQFPLQYLDYLNLRILEVNIMVDVWFSVVEYIAK